MPTQSDNIYYGAIAAVEESLRSIYRTYIISGSIRLQLPSKEALAGRHDLGDNINENVVVIIAKAKFISKKRTYSTNFDTDTVGSWHYRSSHVYLCLCLYVYVIMFEVGGLDR